MVVCGMARGSPSLSPPFIAIYCEERPRSRLQTRYQTQPELRFISKKETHPVRLIIKRLLIIILSRCIQAHFFHKAGYLNSEVTCLMSHGPFPHVKISMGTRLYTSLVPRPNFRARPAALRMQGVGRPSSEYQLINYIPEPIEVTDVH